MPDSEDPRLLNKQLVKEALQEWLDRKFNEAGGYLLKSILAFVFVMVITPWLMSHLDDLRAFIGAPIPQLSPLPAHK